MRLPQHLLHSPYFQFANLGELLKACADNVAEPELVDARRLADLGLPPVTSRMTLATMFGISPGLVWSFESRPQKHYRTFFIPKGKGMRRIDAPRIALKVIQKWLSVHLQRSYLPPEHVFGFVPTRSHVAAAAVHCEAKWIFSVDLKNFFQSTPDAVVVESLMRLGFGAQGASLIAGLCCLNGALAQGAPSSPVLSNICFLDMDERLSEIAAVHDIRLSRYADDITFSGTSEFPTSLSNDINGAFEAVPWRLAAEKTHFAMLPSRLKVHGLLVHGGRVRLTKGYRNRLRAFRHLFENNKVNAADRFRIAGHLNYGSFVER